MVPEATFYSGFLGQIHFNQSQSNEALQIAVHAIHRVLQQKKNKRKKNTLSILTHRHTVNKFCKIAKNMNLWELPKRSRFSHHPLTYSDRMFLFFDVQDVTQVHAHRSVG